MRAKLSAGEVLLAYSAFSGYIVSTESLSGCAATDHLPSLPYRCTPSSGGSNAASRA